MVLGAFVEPGRANPAFDRLVDALPDREGATASVEDVDVLDLLPPRPDSAARWAYRGLAHDAALHRGRALGGLRGADRASEDQISAYTSLYEDTNRPLQPLRRPRARSENSLSGAPFRACRCDARLRRAREVGLA